MEFSCCTPVPVTNFAAFFNHSPLSLPEPGFYGSFTY